MFERGRPIADQMVANGAIILIASLRQKKTIYALRNRVLNVKEFEDLVTALSHPDLLAASQI
jgi:hypothetical protein